jgi:hypothetical protein
LCYLDVNLLHKKKAIVIYMTVYSTSFFGRKDRVRGGDGGITMMMMIMMMPIIIMGVSGEERRSIEFSI